MKYFIPIVLIVCLSVIGYDAGKSWLDAYRMRASMQQHLMNWYFSELSLNSKIPGEERSPNDRELRIKLRRAVQKLTEEWEFTGEHFQLHRVNDDRALFDYNYVFTKKITGESRLFMRKYYFDSSTDFPILLRESINEKSKGVSRKIEELTVWNGDFDRNRPAK